MGVPKGREERGSAGQAWGGFMVHAVRQEVGCVLLNRRTCKQTGEQAACGQRGAAASWRDTRLQGTGVGLGREVRGAAKAALRAPWKGRM